MSPTLALLQQYVNPAAYINTHVRAFAGRHDVQHHYAPVCEVYRISDSLNKGPNTPHLHPPLPRPCTKKNFLGE